jgi:hypothetical protein
MQKQIAKPFILLAATTIFMLVAIINGYGLVTSDTGSYIKYAFDFQVPADRSPFYGIFVGIASVWCSLWLALFIQCLLLVWIWYELLHLLYSKTSPLIYLATVVGITLLTPASWVASFIMPDVFSAAMLLAILCYMLSAHRHGLYLCFIATCVLMHNSHFLILPLFAVLVWLVSKPYRNKAANLLLLSVGLFTTMCGINYAKGFRFKLSAGSHVFMMGKLSETGILKTYLNDNCDKKSYALCNYKDELPPNAWDFLWDETGPLYKTGGWDSSRAEYNAIIKDVFTTPRYAAMFAGAAITGTAQQLTRNNITVDPLPANAIAGQMIARHYPKELNAYSRSMQTTGAIKTANFNYGYLLVFVLSSVLILHHRKRIYTPNIKFLYLFTLLFILCNVFVTATFANVLDRLQLRVSWVLPAINCALLIHYYLAHRKAKNQHVDTQI